VELVNELEERIEPRSRDTYVVIDDIEDAVAKVHASPWPGVDRDGRLVFAPPERRESTAFQVDALYDAIAAHRSRSNQLGQDRSLRVGDVFLVRGYGDVHDPRPMDAWDDILDVTRDARYAARAAFYGALVPVLDEYDPEADVLLGGASAEVPPAPAGRSPTSRATPAV